MIRKGTDFRETEVKEMEGLGKKLALEDEEEGGGG